MSKSFRNSNRIFWEKQDRLPARLSSLLLLSLFLVLSACRAAQSSPTRNQSRVPEAPSPTATFSPSAPLGSRENPLVFAFPPNPHPSNAQIKATRQLTDFLSQDTGLILVSVIPLSQEEWLEGLGKGAYHLSYLSPLLYAALPSDTDLVPMVAREQGGEVFYSAQFVAHRRSGLQPYFDPLRGQNLQEAPQALAQLRDRRPCWVAADSLAGYLVPRAYLAQASVEPLAPAFLGSHVAVLRALYAPGLCDFGATYTDARTFPTLQGEFPAIREEIQVLWRTPAIIPYDFFVFSRRIPEAERILMAQRLQSLPFRPQKGLLQDLFGIQGELALVEESRYHEFVALLRSLPLDLHLLLNLHLP
uniref:Phosphonate transport system substrate-binding protein n=1 Tax=uncultured Chloroflexota bacterium TaxID=166587 RepID=H5SQ46_9CHLR|nr:phosphonate transport system substrate-binding protein [uncultured Chloroflexota bacterium]